MNGKIASDAVIQSLEKELTNLRVENWMNEVVFHWQWWLLLAVLIVPWLIWWKYVDRKHLLEIFTVGTVIIILSSYLDGILTQYELWHYHFMVLPFLPCFLTADLSLLPVVYMFVYQFFCSFKRFLLAMTIVSGFLAFAGEPFLMWIDVYEMHSWEHYYSFPIYIAIGIIARWLARTLAAKQE